MPPKLIGLIAHTDKLNASSIIRSIFEFFKTKDIPLILEAKTASLIGRRSAATRRSLGERCDLIIVLGGDGTLLRVVYDLGESIKPIFGINLGSLGFLTCAASADFQRAIEGIIAGKFVLSHRKRLAVSVERGGKIIAERTGLNDAVISRGELSRLIRLEAKIDGVPLTEFNSDGLVVATPTGSTAYSLSAGGPIVMPGSGVFVVTPICPHVLTNRSVIVSDHSEIEIRPCRGGVRVFLTVDGQELIALKMSDSIRIRKAAIDLPLVTLPELSFSEVLREKLKWSGSAI
jgi:NAD+ kinase